MSNILAKLLRPRVVSIKEETANKAEIVIEPLERGFGHTLGNAFRRILLSSIPGYAITNVQIDGVAHEFSTMENVKEDEIETLEEKIYYQYRESEVEKFRKNALYNNEFTPEMII